jgi:hypothetical protein
MGHEQDRLARPGVAQPRHQVALARRRFEHLHVVEITRHKTVDGDHGRIEARTYQ